MQRPPSSGSRSARRSPARILEPAYAGQLIHRAIGDLLACGKRDPRYEDLLVAAGAVVAGEPIVSYRQAVRQQVITGCGAYFRLFAPPHAWRFLGREVPLSGCRLDLVYERRGAQPAVIVDEVKVGRLADASSLAAAEEQARRQATAASRHYGARFLGVRVVALGAPAASWLQRPDGSKQTLGKGR